MPEQNPPQPENYSPKTHLLQVISRSLNPEVRNYFDPKGEFDDENISTPETALKRACLIDPEESLLLNACKMIFYGLMSGKLSQDIGNQFYGIPKTSFKEQYRGLDTQVTLLFRESSSDARLKNRSKHPLDMQISFRLLTKAEQLTQSDITTLQNRIIAQFPPSWQHYKGLRKFTYHDPKNGIHTSYVMAKSEGEAIEFIRKVCNVIGCTFDESYLSKTEKSKYKTETNLVLGKTSKKTNKPRSGIVRFNDSYMYIDGAKDRRLVRRYGDKILRESVATY